MVIVQNLSVPLDRRVWLECQALRDAGFGVCVICPRFPDDAAYEERESIHIYRYRPAVGARGALTFAYEFLYCWVATALLAVKVLTRHGIDAVQTCNPPDTYWALALLLRLGRHRPYVFDQHDLCPELFRSRFPDGSRLLEVALRALERMNYRVADHVVVTNGSYRDVAIRRGRRKPDDVTVVRSGPLTSVMTPGPPDPSLRSDGRRLCCYLGVMGPQDDVDLLLRSWHVLVHELGYRNAHLALIGSGDCFDELRQLARELDLEGHVTFTGRVPQADVDRYLRSSEIGLSPDGFSPLNDVSTMNKTMEYMSYGLPVVAYDLKETRVSAGEAGVYVPPNDVVAYARAVQQLLDNPAHRAMLGRAARHRAETVLDWRLQERKYVAVYRRLLGFAAGPTTQPRNGENAAGVFDVDSVALMDPALRH